MAAPAIVGPHGVISGASDARWGRLAEFHPYAWHYLYRIGAESAAQVAAIRSVLPPVGT